MKGLFIKDVRLIGVQKKIYIIVFFVALFLLISGQDVQTAIAYVTFVSAFFSVSSISYDESNNGMQFLFTLPFKRSDYVLEKYLFGSVTGIVSWLAAILLTGIRFMVDDSPALSGEWIIGAVVSLLLMLLFLALMIPVTLKFGMEKGRIIIFTVFLATGLIIYTVEQGLGGIQITAWLERVTQIGMAPVAVAGILLIMAVYLLSIAMSVRIMNKKQF